MIDDGGHFRGIIDDNLAGEDAVLNIFMAMGLFGFGHLEPVENDPQALPYLNEKTQNSNIEMMLDTFRALRKYHTFSEIEAETALLLYKYIVPIEYAEISAFEDNVGDDRKINLSFDFIEHELSGEDIDFRGALLD